MHLSPIHPQLILDVWRKEGLYDYAGVGGRQIEAFRVPASLIRDQTAVCYQSHNFAWGEFNPDLEKFWKFQSGTYRELHQVDPDQIRAWNMDRAAERRLFWFSHTMHVLAQQSLDVSRLEVVICS